MATRTVTRIDVLSAAKFGGVFYGGLGLLIGGCLMVVGLLMSAAGAAQVEKSGFPMAGALLSVGAVVFVPVFYGVIGFIGGAVMSALYNLVAHWMGGLRIELSD